MIPLNYSKPEELEQPFSNGTLCFTGRTGVSCIKWCVSPGHLELNRPGGTSIAKRQYNLDEIISCDITSSPLAPQTLRGWLCYRHPGLLTLPLVAWFICHSSNDSHKNIILISSFLAQKKIVETLKSQILKISTKKRSHFINLRQSFQIVIST